MTPQHYFPGGLLLLVPLVLAQTLARPTADDYPASAAHQGVAVGAEVLAGPGLQAALPGDVTRCCVVVEVGVFTDAAGVPLGLERFTLRVASSKKAVHAASPQFVATMLQQLAAHDFAREQTVTIAAGTKPGMTGTTLGPDPGMNPGATEHDRVVEQSALAARALPLVSTGAPLAGYLYFPVVAKANVPLRLEFNDRGASLDLALRH